jgi:hypothetical protein
MLEGLEQDVARDHEHGDTAPLDGTTHRDVENEGELSSCAGQLAVDAAFAEQLLRVGLLEVVAADLGAGDVGRDRKHRNPAAIGVKQPVDQVLIGLRVRTYGSAREVAAEFRRARVGKALPGPPCPRC